jgi:hypothetical protein
MVNTMKANEANGGIFAVEGGFLKVDNPTAPPHCLNNLSMASS